MVNTGVSDPEHRRLNRMIDRQKKRHSRSLEKLLIDPNDTQALYPFSSSTDKKDELKMKREKLAQEKRVEIARRES